MWCIYSFMKSCLSLWWTLFFFELALKSDNSLSDDLFLFLKGFYFCLFFNFSFQLDQKCVTDFFWLFFILFNELFCIIQSLDTLQKLLFALIYCLSWVFKRCWKFRELFGFQVKGQLFVKVRFLFSWELFIDFSDFCDFTF